MTKHGHKLSNESSRVHRAGDHRGGGGGGGVAGGANLLQVQESTGTSQDPHDVIVDDAAAENVAPVEKSQERLGEGDEQEEGEYSGEDGEGGDAVKVKLLQVQGVGRPLVWVRIRPTEPFDTSIFQVGEDEKKLRIIIEPEDRLLQKKTGATSAFTFFSDGILQTSEQEEVFQKTVKQLVEKGMEGVSGAVLCVGPEISGKNYTLFGPMSKYQHRGLVPRSLELIFDTIQAKQEDLEYHVILSMFEIHTGKIKDLFTLGPYDLNRVGEFGPKGLFYEEISSLEHGLSLILRGLTGQGLLHPEPFQTRYHTIVYVDILAKEKKLQRNKGDVKEWRSRLTFSKIASIPLREKAISKAKDPSPSAPNAFSCPQQNCFEPQQAPEEERLELPADPNPDPRLKPKCCRGPSGELAEGISIRRDMYFLEQMFLRSHELRKIHDYYNKLQSMGMYMLIRPPKLAPSQYFRQSKLTHCLKDIVSGNTIVRVILHVRPDRAFLQSTLESMRFAARARCIPVDPVRTRKAGKGCGDDDCLTFEEKINNMCQEMGIPNPGRIDGGAGIEGDDGAGAGANVNVNNFGQLAGDVKISPDQLKMVLTQATAFFDEKLDQLEGQCKDQVKSLFETFRETLIHVFDKDRENFYEFEHRQSADIDQLDDHDPFDHRNSTSNRKGPRKDKQGGKGVTTPKKGKSRGNHRVSGAVNKRQHNSHLSAEQDDDKSGGEGGGGAESSDGSPRTDKKSGGGEKSPQFNSAIVTVPGEDGVTEEIDAPSIVTEDGDNFEDGGGNSRENRAKSIEPRKTPDHHEAHQFQEKCWNDFIKSDSGSQVLDQFSQKQDAVRKILTDHDEAQQNLAIGMGKLTHLQLQLDILEQDRKFKGRLLDEHGIPMIITSPQEQQVRLEIQGVLKTEQELMTKLKEIRVSIEECKCRLDAAKREVEHVFQAFCMDAHGKHADLTHLPLSTLTHGVTTTLNRWSRVHRVKSVPKPDADHEPALSDDMLGANEKDIAMAREFEYLKRLARQQVETLMAAYPKRPPWVSYY